MDQTKRGRACEQELARLLAILKSIPSTNGEDEDSPATPENVKKPPLASTEATIIIEDESEYNYDVDSLVSQSSNSSNSVVARCIATLSALCIEGEELIDEASQAVLPALLLYGDDYASSSEKSDVVAAEYPSLRMMSAFFPFLIDVSHFLARVSQVSRALLMQIHAFHNLDSSLLAGASDRPLSRGWKSFGDLLAVLIQTDEVIASRPQIKQHWNAYAKTLETAQHNPGEFGSFPAQLRPLLGVLATIQMQIMAGNSFRNCYEQSFGAVDEDAAFAERMRTTLMSLYSDWERAAATDVPDRRRLTSLVALTSFFHKHFSSRDKKLLRAVWASHKKIVTFHLVGDLLWCPCHFLLTELPTVSEIVDKKSIDFVRNTKNSLFEQQSEKLVEEAFLLAASAKDWACSFRLTMWQTRAREAAECLEQADAILKGARLADSMNRLLKTVLNCKEFDNEMVFPRRILLKIFSVIQAIKLISQTFTDHWTSVFEVCQMACQQWRCHMLSVLDNARVQLRELSSGGDKNAGSSLDAVNVAASALLSSASRARLIVATVALDMAAHKKLRSSSWQQLPSLLSRIDTLSRPRRLISRVCDCSFLLFHRHLFRLFASSIIVEMPSSEDIKLLLMAATDCAALARRVLSPPSDFVIDEIIDGLRNDFLAQLCGEVENDLRVMSHPHLKVDSRDKTSEEKFRFLWRLLHLPPLRVLDRIVPVKEFVEDYLSRTFYNLTAVALHDCQTYTKMAMLAEFRYDLVVMDSYLPYQTLNQGLDVVVVVRALGNFVASFNYDLYHQLFVEKRSSSRSVQMLSWEHMANSLRTHGMGVVNTSINIAYQLLRKKLGVITQFMDDDQVKALVSAETKFFEENRKQLRKLYPVTRAERLAKAMADLGRVDDTDSFFDRFCATITQLGNALGFVRSMKAAAELVSSDMLVYDCGVDEDWLAEREEGAEKENGERGDAPGSEAVRVLRDILRENREQDTRNRQYIEKLVSFFASSFRAAPSRFGHLSLLAPLAPAVFVRYVDRMCGARERTRRRAAGGAAASAGGTAKPFAAPGGAASASHDTKELTYVDDGLILGMAYLLSVTDGWESFTALNWFRSTFQKIREERSRLNELTKSGDTTKTAALKLSQLQAYEKECKLLSCSLQCARMLFALDGEKESEEKEKELQYDDTILTPLPAESDSYFPELV